MNKPKQVSRNAWNKRIHRRLKRQDWHLVEAQGDWYQNDQKLRTFYVLDGNGNIVELYWNLTDLARDLRVLRTGETMEGCGALLDDAGHAADTDALAAEVASILAAIGDSSPKAGGMNQETKHLRGELAAANKRIAEQELRWKNLASW